ncbi:MAG: hypothetical protein B9S34_13545 [Opitutia bacterium Tous-C1TDCM]|nr:MAG: hypothetical protein B9S34_13545 [Opitutae bacterium Tous-C1TDCM]
MRFSLLPLLLLALAPLAAREPGAVWRAPLTPERIAALADPHGAAAPTLARALAAAAEVLPLQAAAVSPVPLFPLAVAPAPKAGLGQALAQHADFAGAQADDYETFAAAARRLLAGGPLPRHPADATARRWQDLGATLVREVAAARAALPAGSVAPAGFDALATDLQVLAALCRYHSRRSLAAIHYSLFKRGLRLAELLAATYTEREVVAAWRDLVHVAGDRYPPDVAAHWRAVLKSLEVNLRELEEQCCPPDEAIAKEKVWAPGYGLQPAAGDAPAKN